MGIPPPRSRESAEAYWECCVFLRQDVQGMVVGHDAESNR
jgi:hypothetical protein